MGSSMGASASWDLYFEFLFVTQGFPCLLFLRDNKKRKHVIISDQEDVEFF